MSAVEDQKGEDLAIGDARKPPLTERIGCPTGSDRWIKGGCTVACILSIVGGLLYLFLAGIIFDDDDSGPVNVTIGDNVIDTGLFREAELVNLEEIQVQVGFEDETETPYPDGLVPYNVDINVDQSCFVIFDDDSKETYRLVSSVDNPDPENPLVFRTHERPCGVCSSLQDLATYIETPDLAEPVRQCAIDLFSNTFECILDIGFSETCARIWNFNADYTRSVCTIVCLQNLLAPNNVANGGTNFCEPGDEVDQCMNTINGGQACDDFQFEEGQPFRLNECIQCDECRAGPLFQKIAGRTRRNSGVVSGIERPNVAEGFAHDYFV